MLLLAYRQRPTAASMLMPTFTRWRSQCPLQHTVQSGLALLILRCIISPLRPRGRFLHSGLPTAQDALSQSPPVPPASPHIASDASLSNPLPSTTFIPRFSTPTSPRSLTSTTAALWALRRAASAAATPLPTLSQESSVYPRHPRFESMDRQLSSALSALSQRTASRDYLVPSDSALSILLPLASSPAIYDPVRALRRRRPLREGPTALAHSPTLTPLAD